jgi:hypothetical protein
LYGDVLSSTILTLDAPRVSQSSSTDVGALHCTAALGPVKRSIVGPDWGGTVLIADGRVVVVDACDDDVVDDGAVVVVLTPDVVVGALALS